MSEEKKYKTKGLQCKHARNKRIILQKHEEIDGDEIVYSITVKFLDDNRIREIQSVHLLNDTLMKVFDMYMQLNDLNMVNMSIYDGEFCLRGYGKEGE